MKNCFKFLLISSVLLLTSACQDTLDTTSNEAKEQSIKQMMVGIYPLNQKIFKQALVTIYAADQKVHSHLTPDEITALTDQRLKGKTVEDILHLSFISKKQRIQKLNKQLNKQIDISYESESAVASIAKESNLKGELVKTVFTAE